MYTKAMALFIKREDQRTELQERIAAELRQKLKTESQLEYEKPENNIESTTHESEHLGPVLVIVGALVVLGVAYLLFAR
jgi:hypothetical protein